VFSWSALAHHVLWKTFTILRRPAKSNVRWWRWVRILKSVPCRTIKLSTPMSRVLKCQKRDGLLSLCSMHGDRLKSGKISRKISRSIIIKVRKLWTDPQSCRILSSQVLKMWLFPIFTPLNQNKDKTQSICMISSGTRINWPKKGMLFSKTLELKMLLTLTNGETCSWKRGVHTKEDRTLEKTLVAVFWT